MWFQDLWSQGGGSPAGAMYQSVLESLVWSADPASPVLLNLHETSPDLMSIKFIVDRPLLESQGEEIPPKFANIVRLQVYGAPEIKAVRVTVEPDAPWVFSFSPLYN